MRENRGARRCERRKPLKKSCNATNSDDLRGAQASPLIMGFEAQRYVPQVEYRAAIAAPAP